MTTTETTETTTQAPSRAPSRTAWPIHVEDWKPISAERLATDADGKNGGLSAKSRWCADNGWFVTRYFGVADGAWDRFSLGKYLSGDRSDAQSMLDYLRDIMKDAAGFPQVVPGLPYVRWEFQTADTRNGEQYDNHGGQFVVPLLATDGAQVLTVNARKFYSLSKIVLGWTSLRSDGEKLFWQNSAGEIVAVLMGIMN